MMPVREMIMIPMTDPEDIPWLTDKERRELALTFREHAASPLNAAWKRVMNVQIKGLFYQFQTLKDFDPSTTAKIAGKLEQLHEMIEAPASYDRWLAKQEKKDRKQDIEG